MPWDINLEYNETSICGYMSCVYDAHATFNAYRALNSYDYNKQSCIELFILSNGFSMVLQLLIMALNLASELKSRCSSVDPYFKSMHYSESTTLLY